MKIQLSNLYKITGLVLATLPIISFSNDDDDLSLSDLLNLEISVTSKSSTETPRDAASIVAIITQEEIQKNHCRDLADVISMVPGFNLAKDDDYLSFFGRGLFAYEGRALIQVDGMQLSDLYFGSYELSNDFPIHLIKQIEVIRGPGSVLYGGTAEIAVINLVTYSGSELEGMQGSARYGFLPTGKTGHMDLGFSFGEKTESIEYSFLGFTAKGQRTDGKAKYIGRDFSYDHNFKSAGNSSNVFLLKAKILDKTTIQSSYTIVDHNQVPKFSVDSENPDPSSNTYEDIIQGIQGRKVSYSFENLNANISHKFDLYNDLFLLPSVSYQYSYPLQRDRPREDVTIQRFKPSLYLDWSKAINETHFVNFTVGGEYFADWAWVNRPNPSDPVDFLRKSANDVGRDTLLIHNYATYANAKYRFSPNPVRITTNFGVRYDKSELYGDKINPRLGLSAVYNKLHGKLLYNTAFRSPLVGNTAFSRYGLNPDTSLSSRPQNGVTPENIEVFEAEVGYQITDNLYYSINAFAQTMDNIIEFRYNYQNNDLYSDNGGTIGTKGFESELRYMNSIISAQCNVSFVQPTFYNNENPWAYAYNDAKGGDTYISPDSDSLGNPINLNLLGVPAIKVFSGLTITHWKQFPINMNVLYVGERDAYAGNATSKRLPSQQIFSLGVDLIDIIGKLDVSFDIHDIMNERLNIATAWYDGAYDALPYKGREFSVTLTSNF